MGVEMKLVNDRIAQHKIVPVIMLHSADAAVPLAEALVKGGLPVAEITFRTDAAAGAIKNVAKAYPEILVGAGTVTSVEQAKCAEAAGARFIVTPGFSRTVTEYCAGHRLPIFPGVCTPSELMWLLEYGLDVAKFFPAAQYGGLGTIKALSAPFPQMKFMPTGGVSETNILEYLSHPKIIACGGSWMVRKDLLDNGQFDEVEALTAKAVSLVKGV